MCVPFLFLGFSIGRSKAAPLLQFSFVRASAFSYVTFVLLLFMPQLVSFGAS